MKVLGIVGSYHEGGIIDTAVTEALTATEDAGAKTEKIFLAKKNIQFCRNCRQCMQEPGREPGRCVIDDDMAEIIGACLAADVLIIGSPVNMGSVTAVTKAFMERLAPLSYWPWGQSMPKHRDAKRSPRPRAVLITSSVSPALLGKLFFSAPGTLRDIAGMFDARVTAQPYLGLVGRTENGAMSERQLRMVRRAGAMAAWHRGFEVTWPIDSLRAKLAGFGGA